MIFVGNARGVFRCVISFYGFCWGAPSLSPGGRGGRGGCLFSDSFPEVRGSRPTSPWLWRLPCASRVTCPPNCPRAPWCWVAQTAWHLHGPSRKEQRLLRASEDDRVRANGSGPSQLDGAMMVGQVETVHTFGGAWGGRGSVHLGGFCCQTGIHLCPRKDQPSPRYRGCSLGGGGFKERQQRPCHRPLVHSEA